MPYFWLSLMLYLSQVCLHRVSSSGAHRVCGSVSVSIFGTQILNHFQLQMDIERKSYDFKHQNFVTVPVNKQMCIFSWPIFLIILNLVSRINSSIPFLITKIKQKQKGKINEVNKIRSLHCNFCFTPFLFKIYSQKEGFTVMQVK